MKTKRISLSPTLRSTRKHLVPKEPVQEPADVPAARAAMGRHTGPTTCTRPGTRCPSTGGGGHRLSALLTLPRLVLSGRPQADLQIADRPFHTLFQLPPPWPIGICSGCSASKGCLMELNANVLGSQWPAANPGTQTQVNPTAAHGASTSRCSHPHPGSPSTAIPYELARKTNVDTAGENSGQRERAAPFSLPNGIWTSYLKECTKLRLQSFCTTQYCQQHKHGTLFLANHTIQFYQKKRDLTLQQIIASTYLSQTFLVQLQSQTWHSLAEDHKRKLAMSTPHPVHLSKGITQPPKNPKQKPVSEITHPTNSE